MVQLLVIELRTIGKFRTGIILNTDPKITDLQCMPNGW